MPRKKRADQCDVKKDYSPTRLRELMRETKNTKTK